MLPALMISWLAFLLQALAQPAGARCAVGTLAAAGAGAVPQLAEAALEEMRRSTGRCDQSLMPSIPAATLQLLFPVLGILPLLCLVQ